MIDEKPLTPVKNPLKGIATKNPSVSVETSAREALTSDPCLTIDRSIRKEIGGYDGPEPTRFGDWQYNGRCTDF